MYAAIEYIKSNQTQEGRLVQEVHRLRDASDFARDAQTQIDNLQTEIAVMQERLRRMDPGSTHIYGACTSKLSQAQAQAQANGQAHQFSLPAMNAAPTPQQHYAASGTASQGMQGVEYGSRHH
jgi:hypothetical protein